MSDDQTRPLEPDAPTPAATGTTDQPAYAMPLPAGYPAYAGPQQRPRFADQVVGMRSVVAVALACLIIGGLSGFILGHAAGNDGGGFGGRGPGSFQRGGFPNGGAMPQAPNQQFGQGQAPNGR